MHREIIMPGLMIMLPVALIIAGIFLFFFMWSVNNGDYEDMEMMKYKIIYDDEGDADRKINVSENRELPLSAQMIGMDGKEK